MDELKHTPGGGIDRASADAVFARRKAETEAVQRNDKELEDARWFTREELLNGDGGMGIAPRPISIARRLIDDWLAEG